MNTPKMRGLRQIFAFLEIYGNNKFFDGKKLEIAHTIGKLQTRHNNFKGDAKENTSLACFRRLIFFYVFNGGKRGDQWQYSIGTQGALLTNLHNRTKPHPLIEPWIMPDPQQQQPSSEQSFKITEYFAI